MSDVALATLVLAFFTMLAVVVPVITEALQRRDERRSAARLLHRTLRIFMAGLALWPSTSTLAPKRTFAGWMYRWSRRYRTMCGARCHLLR